MAKKTQAELKAAIEQHKAKRQFTYKTDIWQRCTDDEANTLDTQLNQATAKQRRMWDDSLSIEHSSDYYALLRDQMITAFGELRTDEILAPSK